MLKKAWKIVLAVVLALLVVVLGYVAYVFIDYHRIGDQELTVERNAAATVEAGKEYGILSYNIGFGAYEDDYSFFMDGGTESRAWSEERLTANIERIGTFLQQQDADLYLLQEVDRDSTRSYHVDEAAMLTAQLPGLGHIWAQNYDSPYLFYPLDQPHGKSVSGLLTLSSFGITEARRVELPIEAGVMKLVDLIGVTASTASPPPTAGSWCCIMSICPPTPPTVPSLWSSWSCCGRICRRSMKRATGALPAATSIRICWASRRRSSAALPRATPGRSPCRRVSGTAPICRWWLRWTRRTPSPAAATPTLRITRDSTC